MAKTMHKKKMTGLLCDWVGGHCSPPPASLWVKGDNCYSYGLLIAERVKDESGQVVGVRMVPGPWSSKTTQGHRNRIIAMCNEQNVPVNK